MCERCDKLAELVKQTREGKSVVVLSFPNGEPELIRRPSDSEADSG